MVNDNKCSVVDMLCSRNQLTGVAEQVLKRIKDLLFTLPVSINLLFPYLVISINRTVIKEHIYHPMTW